MKLSFYGAAGTVTGSCYHLQPDSSQPFFVDCGIFQGFPDADRLNAEPFPCNCAELVGVVLTHAHLDHCGRLPTLLRQGFQAPIWMTAPTQDLVEISLYDAAKISAYDHPETALFTDEEVAATLELIRVVEYGVPFQVGDAQCIFRDAGHILGSAIVEIFIQNKHYVFSGDLGNSPQEIIRPTTTINSGDVVVMESTYGGDIHPAENPSKILQTEINAVEANNGTLLIPAFSIERSQELLHRIAHLKKEGKVRAETPIYFDSPMAAKVTRVFENYPKLYNAEFAADVQAGHAFEFPGLVVVDTSDERAELNEGSGAKVIVAGSGMMTGGRIVSHAQKYLPLPTTRLLFVGYQGEGTLGRAILDGAKAVVIKGQKVPVNAAISRTRSLSSHADQPKLIKWLRQIQGASEVVLVHGENMPRSVLKETIAKKLTLKKIHLPLLHDQIEV